MRIREGYFSLFCQRVLSLPLIFALFLLCMLHLPLIAGSDAGWVSMNRGRMDEEIRSMVWVDGVLYVAGPFSHIAGIKSRGIAKWDGSAWSTLGEGVDGDVNSIVADSNGNIYVGGLFSNAGGKPALNVAKWDGSEWSALGKGIAGQVNAVIIDKDGLLYAGGFFTTTGNGVGAQSVACWKGTEWESVGIEDYLETASGVFALAVDSAGCLYATGYDFSPTCSICYYGIVLKREEYDWRYFYSKAGPTSGIRYAVESIQIDRAGTVYISGGSLCCRGSVDTEWLTIKDGWNHRVIAVGDSGDVYMQEMNEEYGTGRLIKWNPDDSSVVGSSRGRILCATFDPEGAMYLGGAFGKMKDIYTQNLVRLDGEEATAIFPTGIDSTVYWVMCNNEGNVYIGGVFSPVNVYSDEKHFRKLDGDSWVMLPDIPAERPSSEIVDSRGNVYMVDDYEDIIRWDGTEWKPFADVFSLNYIRRMAIDADDNIYIGGGFDSVGVAGASTKIPVANVARWNGTEWRSIGDGLDSYIWTIATGPVGTVYAMAYSRADSIDRIIKWDGTSWSEIGTVHNVDATAAFNLTADCKGNVYVCGPYDSIGGISCSCAMWNGSSWTALNKRLRVTYCGQITDTAGNLYVTGEFDSIGEYAAHNIARWNGQKWEALGSGIIYDIYHPYVGLAFDEKVKRLYVTRSPEKEFSPYLSAYDFIAGNSAGFRPHGVRTKIRNPVSWRVRNSRIVFSGVKATDCISVYNVSGRLLKTSIGAGAMDLANMAPQALVVRVRSGADGAVIASGIAVKR